jgi:hypothetical protein
MRSILGRHSSQTSSVLWAGLLSYDCFFSNYSGPIVAAVLARENAIQAWRNLLGPTDSNKARATAPTRYELNLSSESDPASLRARFGTDGSRNAAHGSDSVQSAAREIRFFFPEGVHLYRLEKIILIIIAVCEPLPSSARDYITRSITPTLLRGLAALCKAKPEAPVSWLADWLAANNPNKPVVQEPAA